MQLHMPRYFPPFISIEYGPQGLKMYKRKVRNEQESKKIKLFGEAAPQPSLTRWAKRESNPHGLATSSF